MKVLCFLIFFSGVTLDLLLHSSMEDLEGWGVKVETDENVGLDWDAFPSLSFWSSISWIFLSSTSRSSSQSKDIGYSLGYIFPSGVKITQYLVCSVWRYRWSWGLHDWCFHWLARCGGLTCACHFLSFEHS